MNDSPATTTVVADEPTGTGIVRFDVAGTAIFLVVGALGVFATSTRPAVVVVSVALFTAGVAAFIWSFFSAAERSRDREIGVANLYLLTGPTAPRRVRRALQAALGAQVIGCLVVAAVGFSGTEPDDVNLLAFGILVPMFGLGLNGVWASRHGTFGPRIVSAPARSRREVPPSDHDLEKNAPHG